MDSTVFVPLKVQVPLKVRISVLPHHKPYPRSMTRDDISVSSSLEVPSMSSNISMKTDCSTVPSIPSEESEWSD